jgi:hypothetical protein
LSADFTAGAAADFTLFHVFTDIALAAVGVQGDFGALEHQQQLGIVLIQALEQLIERLAASFLAKHSIEALRQGTLGFFVIIKSLANFQPRRNDLTEELSMMYPTVTDLRSGPKRAACGGAYAAVIHPSVI